MSSGLGRMAPPPPGGGWFPSLSVARAVGSLTEWLVSFWNGLGSHCGAVLALPALPSETSWAILLAFGASDAAVHSLWILQNHWDLQGFAHLFNENQCNIN